MLEGPDLLHQPLPLDRSILWKPGVEGGGGGRGLIPDSIFVAQAAVAALREHAGSAPEKSLLGFLVGDLCQTPDTATRYILVGSLIRVTQPGQGDRTTIVVKALWDRVRAEVKKAGRRLLGWYHTHQDLGIELSSYDVETHERYFTEPWQVAVVIGTAEGEPAAGFYRSGGDESWAATCLPFYEVLKDESLGEGGKKRSYVVWKNSRAPPPALPPPPPAAPPRPARAPAPAPAAAAPAGRGLAPAGRADAHPTPHRPGRDPATQAAPLGPGRRPRALRAGRSRGSPVLLAGRAPPPGGSPPRGGGGTGPAKRAAS